MKRCNINFQVIPVHLAQSASCAWFDSNLWALVWHWYCIDMMFVYRSCFVRDDVCVPVLIFDMISVWYDLSLLLLALGPWSWASTNFPFYELTWCLFTEPASDETVLQSEAVQPAPPAAPFIYHLCSSPTVCVNPVQYTCPMCDGCLICVHLHDLRAWLHVVC